MTTEEAGLIVGQLRYLALFEGADPVFLNRAASCIESLSKDAERYRFLRRFDHFATVDSMLNTTQYNTLDAAVDAAIDKAIRS